MTPPRKPLPSASGYRQRDSRVDPISSEPPPPRQSYEERLTPPMGYDASGVLARRIEDDLYYLRNVATKHGERIVAMNTRQDADHTGLVELSCRVDLLEEAESKSQVKSAVIDLRQVQQDADTESRRRASEKRADRIFGFGSAVLLLLVGAAIARFIQWWVGTKQ